MNDDLVKKIRALLALAKSDNAHEAQLAMQRAMEIAAKHQIDLASISPDDELNKLTGDHLNLPARLATEWKEALHILHGFFNVNVTTICGWNEKKALIVGTKLDIELANYVVTFLVRACRQCLAAFKAREKACRRRMTTNKTHSFVKGFFWGIQDSLNAQKRAVEEAHAGYQLMLDNGRAARTEASQPFLKGCGPSTTLTVPDRRLNRAASFRGFVEGSKTEIRPGLRGGAPLALE